MVLWLIIHINAINVRDFHRLFIRQVRQRVTRAVFSFNIKSALLFWKERVRQGDPVSPYLFRLVMEAFTATMDLKSGLLASLIIHNTKSWILPFLYLQMISSLYVVQTNIPLC